MTVDSGVKISERKAPNLLMAREANKKENNPNTSKYHMDS